MALFIDFDFINIRDLIDFSEVDSEFENQLQNLVAEIFENPPENPATDENNSEESAIRFLSELVAESNSTLSSEPNVKGVTVPAETTDINKDVADILTTPIVPTIAAAPKQTVAPKKVVDKNGAYIKYINSKYDQNQAEYFIRVLLNPVQTHLRNRFDYADVRNNDLTSRILGKDKDSTEKAEENRRRQNEQLRAVEAERRAETLKKTELNKLFDLKSKGQGSRV